jgi:hypothetical protein
MNNNNNNNTVWNTYPNYYGNISVFLVIFLFIISGFIELSGLVHPRILFISEAIKSINLPSFLTSENILKWEFQGISKFFNHKIIYSQKKQNYKFKEKQYIKCLMPHGIVPFSIWCLWGDEKEKDAFNCKDNTFVTSNQLYEFPIISHYAKACNSIPANYKDMEDVLNKKKSLIVYPGGLREMFACSDKKEVVVINKRRGIFYMALKNGISLLPIYTFGITKLYERSGVTITLPFFFKNDKDSLAWYYGKYYTPFPMRKNLITIVGNPIYVTKQNVITKNDIDNLRNKYIIIIKNIYYKWASKYDSSWRNRELIIE